MKLFIVTITFLVLANAYDHGFPNDDQYHAGCHMNTTLTPTTCEAAYNKTNTLISENVDTGSDYKGLYGIHSESGVPTGDEPNSWIWSNRLTYNKKYTDDQMFEFTPVGVTSPDFCEVVARSRSESRSYLDNGVNFCNMWNILSRLDGWTGEYTVSNCKTEPSDPATTCARY